MTAWIEMIEPDDAEGELAEIYKQVLSPHGTVDNVMKVHSLQPRTMLGHLQLYRSILHNDAMTLPTWYLEVVASYVSILNKCAYSLTHHFTNARRLMPDELNADDVYAALQDGTPGRLFSGIELALLDYAEKLTRNVAGISCADLLSAKDAGANDQEILEVNQVVAYFNYSNRVLNGLGVTTDGDVVGYY